MRAAILNGVGATPEVGDFEAPAPRDGQVTIDVVVAGVNPVDLAMASGAMGSPQIPSVVGREGVGTLPDGRRVYFSSPIAPQGSWAEQSLVDPDRVLPVPDGLEDDLAVCVGIAGLAAWLPLAHHARLEKGESVLVLGGTGVVGQIAVQAAKLLGAGRVVAAGRDPSALQRATQLGADATVVLGGGDDSQALSSEAGEGFDVVIDPIYGPPFVAALGATASGARLVSIGVGAGATAEISLGSLMGRSHIGHANHLVAPHVQADAYATLTEHARAGRIDVEIRRFTLDEAPSAWQAQADGPHQKLVIAP